MMLIAIRRAVLVELARSPEWLEKLERAETEKELVDVLVKFCKAKGFAVKHTKF